MGALLWSWLLGGLVEIPGTSGHVDAGLALLDAFRRVAQAPPTRDLGRDSTKPHLLCILAATNVTGPYFDDAVDNHEKIGSSPWQPAIPNRFHELWADTMRCKISPIITIPSLRTCLSIGVDASAMADIEIECQPSLSSAPSTLDGGNLAFACGLHGLPCGNAAYRLAILPFCKETEVLIKDFGGVRIRNASPEVDWGQTIIGPELGHEPQNKEKIIIQTTRSFPTAQAQIHIDTRRKLANHY
ncbi:hypothetical protein ColLi_05723 [Colletotrichum liriopes]|uniref:Uncharacterized protein n=1 Tax=Colletotrichum liriopes TaxID=708192 RepID=A0AA37LRM8_9PEZI|nr:hypothetical protein ColLi_05723 [Colletotrichum liriopes]